MSIRKAPEGFDLGDLPTDVIVHHEEVPADIYLIFETVAADAENDFARLLANIPADGAIWVAFPKKASGMDTDLSGNMARDLFLPTAMVDNKVCAIDETWTGLRFVVRKENRAGWRV
ncbi:MAG TPA: DUF3052 domain-containing protein [Acidimicrobiia bacterium]|nr:DUF3052 domain-containing protein [Acidimicrobiia bacterium]